MPIFDRPRCPQIRRYLLHRVQAAEAAAANHSAGGDAGSSGEEGGSAAGGASAAAFLQLLAEASVRQSEVRLAIRRAGRELGLPPKKVGAEGRRDGWWATMDAVVIVKGNGRSACA